MKNILARLELETQVSKKCLKQSKSPTQKEYFRGQEEAYQEAIRIIKSEMKDRRLMLDD